MAAQPAQFIVVSQIQIVIRGNSQCFARGIAVCKRFVAGPIWSTHSWIWNEYRRTILFYLEEVAEIFAHIDVDLVARSLQPSVF